MKKIKILTMLMALVAFTSCYNDEVADNQKADTSRPIVLSSALEKSRAVTQDEQIVSGQYVYAWADVASTQASWFNRWLLTANGSGAFTCESGTEKYFPKGNAAIDIYAIHGRYQFAENAAFPSDGYTFSVHNDQSSTVNYCESDLLYGIKKGATYDAAGVDVKFYHMLSKLEVVLKAGGSLTDEDLDNAEVNILGVQAQVTFTPEKLTEVGLADSPTREGMLTLATEEQAAKTAIIMNTVVAPKAATGFGTDFGEACIPPQTFDTDQFIKIVLHCTDYEGTTLYVPLHNQELHSGYKYTFQVTVNSNLAVASVAVTPWGTESNITAEMNANLVKVGDYLFSDGTWGPLGESSSWTSSHYPIAVIFSTNPSAIDRAAGYTHGYALSTGSTGTKLTWTAEGSLGVTNQVQDNLMDTVDEALNNLEGRTETAKILSMSDFSKENYPMAWYATHFGTVDVTLTDLSVVSEESTAAGESDIPSTGYAAPVGTSGWYLGSIGQYVLAARTLTNHVFDYMTSDIWGERDRGDGWVLRYQYMYGVDEFKLSELVVTAWNEKFVAANNSWAPAVGMIWSDVYSNYFFTSSERSATAAIAVNFYIDGKFDMDFHIAKYYVSNNQRGVRPVIAF
jgi:hypothetical protein